MSSRIFWKHRGVTLAELLVAMGLLAMVMTAVLSFYIEASAVTTKRNKISDRLRRFHLGLDKMEQVIREGRVISTTDFQVTLLHLTDLAEQDGFPDFSPTPLQFVSEKDGVHQIFGQEDKNILPFEPGERLIFQWVNDAGKVNPQLLEFALYYSGADDGRSDLLFRRTVNLDVYYGKPIEVQ